MKKRIEWIDILKGYGIFLIVLGHTISYCDKLQNVVMYIYSFHVPLFFAVSGYLFIFKSNNFKEFFIQKFKSIMVPYFVFAFLFLIPYFLLGSNIASDLNLTLDNNPLKMIFGVFYGNGHNFYLKQNSPLWFLPCLFVIFIIFYLINKKIKNKKVIFLISLVFVLIGHLDYNFAIIRLPWSIDIAFSMYFFFSLGYLLKEFDILNKIKNNYKIIISIVLIGIGIYFSQINTQVSYVINYYGNYLYFMISSIAGIVGYFLLFSLLKNTRVKSLFGKYTLGILIFHKPIVVLFQTKIGSIANNLKYGDFIIQIILGLFISIITILISVIIYKISLKYFPILYGKRKSVNKL